MTTAELYPAELPDAEPPRPRWWRQAGVLLGVWTVVGLSFSALRSISALLIDREYPHLENALFVMADAYLWAGFTVPILWLKRRFELRGRALPVTLPVHALAAMCFAWLSAEFDWWLWVVTTSPGRDMLNGYGGFFQRVFYLNVQWYVVIVGVGYAMDYYRGLRERQLQAARLSERLAQARLEALKMQIQPHFLFNTLHSISELVHEDPAAADRMITRLGDLLRLTVDSAGTQEIPLRQEMQFLAAYLEIQRTRFQDTLAVDIDVPPDTQDALVPNLVLQPLVENAIRHGVAMRGGPGRIRVTARREGAELRLSVADDGPGPRPPRPGGRQGVGVSNTRARLEQLYGADQRFELRAGEGGGAVAEVAIPFRAAPAAEGLTRHALARRLTLAPEAA